MMIWKYRLFAQHRSWKAPREISATSFQKSCLAYYWTLSIPLVPNLKFLFDRGNGQEGTGNGGCVTYGFFSGQTERLAGPFTGDLQRGAAGQVQVAGMDRSPRLLLCFASATYRLSHPHRSQRFSRADPDAACLLNSRPGGNEAICVAGEYIQRVLGRRILYGGGKARRRVWMLYGMVLAVDSL